MTALAVNCGSSSIKFQIYGSDNTVLLSGSASNVGSSKPASFKYSHGTKLGEKKDSEVPGGTEYVEVFERILKEVLDTLEKEEGGKIELVSHRIVHGGGETAPVVIHHGTKNEQETLDRMDTVSSFAPLHNHHAMLIVKSCLHTLPDAASVLTFDTSFHSTIPNFRTTYAISQPSHRTPVPLKRYGFHGLSYTSILDQMSEKLGKKKQDVNLVVAHLGSGASVCLIQGGKSVNTSMGLTPLEGLPGGTRSGSIDASLIFHHTPDCSEEIDWSGRKISKAEYVLNKESGLQALTGTNDFGEITSRIDSTSASKSERDTAKMTYDLYLDRLLLYVSSYISTLFSSSAPWNKLDGLVFSGGIGEHSVELRKSVLDALSWIEGDGEGGLDEEENKSAEGKVRLITKKGSKVPAFVVETDEELVTVQLAREAMKQ